MKCVYLVTGTSLVLIVYMELNTLRGTIDAYEHRLYISAPEYPFVNYESSFFYSSLRLKDILSVNVFINCFLPSKLGRGMYNLFTNLLLTASSSYWGRFVAPIIRTLSSLFVFAPSN